MSNVILNNMRKVVAATPNFALQKCATEDCISKLPDEILLSILSLLTMKEAARTSILSRRWQFLWTFFAGSLDFDASIRVETIFVKVLSYLRNEQLDVERPRFVSWVNQVLKSHQGPTVDELRIIFDVNSTNKCDIDSWISFAIEKRVQRLELDFKSCQGFTENGRYAFPSHLLNHSSFETLRALRLTYIDVTGEVLEHLLSNCLFLELLHVEESTRLVSLKVLGLSLKLKYLGVVRCKNVKSLEISATNLISVRYDEARGSSICFKNVPRLLEVSFGRIFGNTITSSLWQFSSVLSQLETLKLDLGLIQGSREFAQEIPELSNLKHLELIGLCYYEGLLPFTFLLKASPRLYKLTLKLEEYDYPSRKVTDVLEIYPCEFLKVVEWVGFVGSIVDAEFMMYLVVNAVALEKIIIDPCRPYMLGSVFEFEFRQSKVVQSAREHAMSLGAQLPSTIEFVLL